MMTILLWQRYYMRYGLRDQRAAEVTVKVIVIHTIHFFAQN